MIIKTEKQGNITIYHVDKDFPDDKLDKYISKPIRPAQIKHIIDDDSDVYTADGNLLLRFRKSVLNKPNIDAFYDNVIKFAKQSAITRSGANGNKTGKKNQHIMSNIFGFFDRWSPRQKYVFAKLGHTPSLVVRECRFNVDYPEEYKKTIPLVQDIDAMYKKLTPDQYARQRRKANQTHFKIPNTSFTTVTTNVNFQTTVHTDKGDDEEGFGNLAVIEHGTYTGAETCFIQYGIGVNVRTGDILLMDVHQPHANLPMHKTTADATRLSIVCYLRTNVWARTKNKTKRFYENHRKTMKNMRTTVTVRK